jgi:hypothetical protein
MNAALLPLLAVTTLSNVDTTYVVDRFREVCVHGQARFTSGQIKEIAQKSMASDVRSYFSDISGHKYDDVKFYELALSAPAYLITWKRKPAPDYYTQGCAVVARDLPYIATWEKVLRVEFSSRDRARLLETEARRYRNEFPVPEEGKKIMIDRIYGGRFVSLQVAAMSKNETRDWQGTSAIKRSPLTERPKQ